MSDDILLRSWVLQPRVEEYFLVKCDSLFSALASSCSGPGAQVTTGADWVTLAATLAYRLH